MSVGPLIRLDGGGIWFRVPCLVNLVATTNCQNIDSEYKKKSFWRFGSNLSRLAVRSDVMLIFFFYLRRISITTETRTHLLIYPFTLYPLIKHSALFRIYPLLPYFMG